MYKGTVWKVGNDVDTDVINKGRECLSLISCTLRQVFDDTLFYIDFQLIPSLNFCSRLRTGDDRQTNIARDCRSCTSGSKQNSRKIWFGYSIC